MSRRILEFRSYEIIHRGRTTTHPLYHDICPQVIIPHLRPQPSYYPFSSKPSYLADFILLMSIYQFCYHLKNLRTGVCSPVLYISAVVSQSIEKCMSFVHKIRFFLDPCTCVWTSVFEYQYSLFYGLVWASHGEQQAQDLSKWDGWLASRETRKNSWAQKYIR